MRVTKKRLTFFLLHLLFSAVLPIVLVIIQYGSIDNSRSAIGFKLSITGILLLLFIFWVAKKLFIDRKLQGLSTQGSLMLADLKTKQNEAELRALEKELKFIKTVEAVLNSIIPMLFLLTGLMAFKALEAQLIRLSGTLGFITVSYFVGIIFSVLCSREIHAKERK